MAGEYKRVFSEDPETRVQEIFHYDVEKDDGSFYIETVQDCEPVFEANKYRANESPDGWRGDMHHIASIPMTVFQLPELRGIVTPAGRILDQKAFAKWLDDRNNMLFRTKTGKLYRASK